MAKLLTPFLIMMLSMSVATIQAKSISSLQNENVPVTVKAVTQHSGYDKSSSISVYINGHNLCVVFSENLGNVVVEITDVSGAVMNFSALDTPTGYMFFISLAGHYTITFTLPNGDEYYAEFDVAE